MKKLKKLIAGLAVFGSLGAGAVAMAPSAGATVPCPIGNQGWFQSYNASYHCTIDSNHIVMDRYQGSSYIQGAVDTWFPPDARPILHMGTLGSYYARFGMCHTRNVLLPTVNGGPYQVDRGYWSSEGVLLWRYSQPYSVTDTCTYPDGTPGNGQYGPLY